MDRRKFIRLGLAGGTAGLIVPKLVLATPSGDTLRSQMAGGLYHTKDAPGRWSKKVTSHLPNIEKQKGEDGNVELLVTTRHEIDGYRHYIVKHMLLDENFAFIDEYMFDPAKDERPESKFQLIGYGGPIYAVSVCNQHDSWVNVIEL